MSYEQKDVVLIPFPYSDLTGAKHRPALIISNELVNISQDRICCLVTSQQPQDGIPIETGCFEGGKLPFRSWIKPHRLFTIHEKIIRKKLCTINDAFHDKIVAKVNECLRREHHQIKSIK